MKGRLRSWMELVLALQVKDNQFSEPHTWDHNESGFLLSLSVLCQIFFVFREGMDGLSEFFPDPFRIINMSLIDDAPKNLQHWSSWSFKPRSLSRKAQIDDYRECPPRLIELVNIAVYEASFNDMRNIKMTMPRMQLNSKFVNNMLPEWSRFITKVKLNRGLKESNFDHLYAYLKQHEVHANKNRTMMERFLQPTNDPLALVSKCLCSHSSTENLIESLSNSLALLTQSYKSHLPQTNNQPRTSSNARNKATVQDGRVVVQDVRGRYNANNQGKPFHRNNARGNVVAGNVGGQNRGGIINPDSDYFKDKMLLMQAQENGAVLDEEHSLFLTGEQVTKFDEDVDNSPENDLALNVDHIFEADECDAFESDVDEGPTTQTMFMANLTSEDPIYDEVGPS
ncbi:hypothetical protein Tco_0267115 [Tanacetum coccineum]